MKMLSQKDGLIYIIIAVVILNLTFISAVDISVSIPGKYERVKAGEELYFNFVIKDLENIGRHDIFLEYEIREEDELITVRTETIAVETQASFFESILIPKDTQSGIYSIIVTVDNKESGSAVFFVEKQINYISTYFLIIIAMLILVILLELYRIRKSVKK